MNPKQQSFDEWRKARNPLVKQNGLKYYKPFNQNRLRFKISIWIYRKFGYTSSLIKDTQAEFLQLNYDLFLNEFLTYQKDNKDDPDFIFSNYIKTKISQWQCVVCLSRRYRVDNLRFLMLRLKWRCFLDKYNI